MTLTLPGPQVADGFGSPGYEDEPCPGVTFSLPWQGACARYFSSDSSKARGLSSYRCDVARTSDG
jgi:hypothetical protein